MAESNVRVIGRYALHNAIAAGGMATVHLGRLLGPVGFSRTVAIKRLHAQFASDPEFVSMFLDEARLAARIRHPNVVPTLDVVATGGELFLVMDYVPGESVARLMRVMRERQQQIPLRILSTIMAGALHGLHAAHEAKDERGHPLGIVHRDVSPQNILLGIDGTPRVLDFGVAKAAGRVQTTREGQIKGKLSYMPPEQLRGASVTRTTDIYAAGVMLWELITGQRLFAGDNEGAIVAKVLEGRVEPPSHVLIRNRRGMTLTNETLRQLESLDQTILRALQMQPEARYQNAREMAVEIERKLPPATASECADWLESVAHDVLSTRAQMIAEIEASGSHDMGEDHIASVLNAKSTLGHSSNRAPQHAASPPSGRSSLPAHMQQTVAMSGSTPRSGILQMPNSARYPVAEPPVTQPSSISVSHGSNYAPPVDNNRRNAVAAIIGVLIGVTVLGGALLYSKSRSTATNVDQASSSATAVVGTQPIPAVTVADPTPAPTATTTAPIDIDIDSVDAGPAHVAAKTPPVNPGGGRRNPVTPPKPQPQAPSAGPTEDCATPYWFDAQGVKRYKQACLDKK